MPRPTRSRFAASRRREPSSDSDSVPAPTSKAAKTDKAPIRSDSIDIYGVSDRELERQRHATRAAKPTTSDKAPQPEGSNTTAGRSTRSRASAASKAMDAMALDDSRTRRDAAMSKLDNLTSTTADAADSSEMINSDVVEVGRKELAMDDSSLLGTRGRGGTNLSGMEIMDDEIFGNLDSSFDRAHDEKDDTGTGTAGAAQTTRSADTSTFNVSVFRRQPRRRQSSIVGRDDAPIRPSSRGPTTPGLSSTFSLGNFKRRARQPSILMSSAQKASLSLQRSRAASEASEANENAVESEDEEGEEEEEESFLPEAEGTPVRVSNGRVGTAKDADEPAQGGARTRSRKRKSTEGHGTEAAKRQAVEPEEEDAIHPSIEVDDRSSPPSFLERSRRAATPELDDDILAPPASSSSSEGGSTVWPPPNNPGKRHHGRAASRPLKTPALDDDMSDISEPPSLTHSPNYNAPKPAAKNKGKTATRKASPKVSTADLEALLPRRRRKARRESEGSEDESGSEGEGDDVYQLPRAAAKRKPVGPLSGSSKANQAGQAKDASAAAKRSARRRTYGSRTLDKENTVEGDSIEVSNEDVSTPLDDSVFAGAGVHVDDTNASLSIGEELKAASRKFKEVDKWELEFEEVVESSSPMAEGR